MTITREQVADLQPGDVVEIRDREWPDVTYRGPLHMERDRLCLGPLFIRTGSEVSSTSMGRTLTVVSRAPRPLYVNHPRTEPARRDVVREDGTDRPCIWTYEDPGDDEPWRHIAGQDCRTHGVRWTRIEQMPARLRLLVDGETGQVAQ